MNRAETEKPGYWRGPFGWGDCTGALHAPHAFAGHFEAWYARGGCRDWPGSKNVAQLAPWALEGDTTGLEKQVVGPRNEFRQSNAAAFFR